MTQPEYRTNTDDELGRSIPDEWRFTLPEGWGWTTSTGNKPEDSWLYVTLPSSIWHSFWMTWAVGHDIMLAGRMGSSYPHKISAKTPEEMRGKFLALLAAEKLGIGG